MNIFGGGDAWKEKGWAAEGDTREWAGHYAVIDHANKLKYPGFIPPAGSDKSTWTKFTDEFNAWKERKGWLDNVAPAETHQPVAGTNDAYYSNPNRQNNPYFPMLYEAWEPPAMQDWSDMPGFENSIFGQEYYQPWAANYPGSQWIPYEPPIFNTPIEYMSPLFAVEAIYPEEESSSSDDNKTNTTDPFGDPVGGGRDLDYGDLSPAQRMGIMNDYGPGVLGITSPAEAYGPTGVSNAYGDFGDATNMGSAGWGGEVPI